MNYLAAVLIEPRRPLELCTLSLGPLHPGQVLVRLHAAGVCHTDYEAWSGSYPVPLPVVLGHEGAGVVEAVAHDVHHLRPGDHVVCSAAPACGGCFYCGRHLPMLCEDKPALGRTTSQTAEGANVQSFLQVSSFAEYCVLPHQGAIKIPSEMPLDRACLLGCAVITGVGAVQRIAGVTPGESVAIVGCGAVGLNVIQGARQADAAIIVAIDTDPGKLIRAAQFGATHCWLASEEDLVTRTRQLTKGRGVDHAFECASVSRSLQLALDLTRPGASITILGKTQNDHDIPLRFGSLLGERRLRRASLGGAMFSVDIPTYVEDYVSGRLLLDEQIDQRLPLDNIQQAFDAIETGNTIRSVIMLA